MAYGSPFLCFLLACLYVFLLVGVTTNPICNPYDLLTTGLRSKLTDALVFLRFHNIPEDAARTPGAPWLVVSSGRGQRQCGDGKQKWGLRG